MRPVRTAIVHYWLVGMRGGERVLEAICDMFPDADIYCHVVDKSKLSPKLLRHRIHTTFISRLPFAVKNYQKYLALMPLALETLDLSDYDLVISSEAGPAKGVITRPDAAHITYCHSPMRYIWDQYHEYAANGGLAAKLMMPLFAPRLRTWDIASASRSNEIMANSAFVAARISKFWGRKSTIVHPPVNTSLFSKASSVSDEYLMVGQLVSYKRPDLAVDAFNANGLPLHIVGEGPMLGALKARAKSNIRFSSRMNFDELRQAYSEARALIFPSEEDFGMIPVEVMASGRPIIAFGRGGALETVIDGLTGILFFEKSIRALDDAISRFEAWEGEFNPDVAIMNASRFGPDQFKRGFLSVVERATENLNNPRHPMGGETIRADQIRPAAGRAIPESVLEAASFPPDAESARCSGSTNTADLFCARDSGFAPNRSLTI